MFPKIRCLARLYASSRSSLVILSLLAAGLSLGSLPASDVGFEGFALEGANSPSSPRRMIFLGTTAGAGELVLEVDGAMVDSGGGILQNGVL